MNRTFIVEDCAEDDFGLWATDEVTSEQGYIDDERSCFWTWDDNEHACSQDHSRAAKRSEEKVKVKEDPKGPEERSLAMNKHKILNGGQKRTLLGGPKERKARKACHKAMMAFRKVGFALYQPDKGTKDQKGKGKEGACPQSGLSASETPNEEGYGHVW